MKNWRRYVFVHDNNSFFAHSFTRTPPTTIPEKTVVSAVVRVALPLHCRRRVQGMAVRPRWMARVATLKRFIHLSENTLDASGIGTAFVRILSLSLFLLVKWSANILPSYADTAVNMNARLVLKQRLFRNPRSREFRDYPVN